MACVRPFIALLVLLAAAVAAPPATAFRIEDRSSADTEQIAATPSRQELEILPGQELSLEVRFQNRTGDRRRFALRVYDIGSDRAIPSKMFALTDGAPFGASEWVTIDRSTFVLEHGQLAAVEVRVKAPDDAEPGSHYAAVTAHTVPDSGESGRAGAATAQVSGGVGSQIFLDVPGPQHHAGSIRDADAPSVVWRGRDTHIALDALYRNEGNVTDRVSGTVALTSITGKDVGLARVSEQVVLRGGTRGYRFLWHDPPWVGRFTPKVRFVGETGAAVERKLDPVWVVPSWKYVLLALAAILAPIGWRLRERRAARLHEEHAAAAAVEEEFGGWEHDPGDGDTDVARP